MAVAPGGKQDIHLPQQFDTVAVERVMSTATAAAVSFERGPREEEAAEGKDGGHMLRRMSWLPPLGAALMGKGEEGWDFDDH